MASPIIPLADRMRSWPLLGRPLSLLARILATGRAQARLMAAEDRLEGAAERLQTLAAELDRLRDRAASDRAELDRLRDRAASDRAELAAELRSRLGLLRHEFDVLRGEWRATLARDSRAIERAAAALAAGRPTAPLDPPRLAAPEVYVDFEDAFRGRWKVEERMRWYMPRLRAIDERLRPRPVLDLGCGRGEFLMELRRNGIPGVGIDLNPAMVDVSRAQGLDVTVGEAVAHLRDREPGSLSAVASFHVIEHLPFEHTLHLLEAAKRALAPGGLLILETPNPENLVVGACTFWYDPTHLRPLPPALMAFHARAAGFEPVSVARFFLRTDGPDAATIDTPVSPSVDGPLDYAILATKPDPDA